jgi:hypothetical protein
LKAIYPEHQWSDEGKKPAGYWMDVTNQRKFFEEIAPQLNVTKHADWGTVGSDAVIRMGGQFIVNYYKGSLSKGTYKVINQ